jgi:hypothetical protein
MEKFKKNFGTYRNNKFFVSRALSEGGDCLNKKTFITQQHAGAHSVALNGNGQNSDSASVQNNPMASPRPHHGHPRSVTDPMRSKMELMDQFFNTNCWTKKNIQGRVLMSRASKGTTPKSNLVLNHKYRGYLKKKDPIFNTIQDII